MGIWLAVVGLSFAAPMADGDVRFRFEVLNDGKSFAPAWDVFLERVFDHFDQDGDGVLSKTEADHVFPLPVPGRKAVKVVGPMTRTAWKTFCHDHGFGPVVVLEERASPLDARLGKFFADVVARKQIASLVRKYDVDEDEVLDVNELLAGAETSVPNEPARSWVGDAPTDSLVRIDLAAGTVVGPKLKFEARNGYHRVLDSNWALCVRPQRLTPNMTLVVEFLQAQFKTALDDREALPKAGVDDDLNLSGLQALFAYADRNGDQRLTQAELKAYFDLLQLGVRTQIWLRVADLERNPFAFLDVNGDGRLDAFELKAAEKWTSVPSQVRVSFGGPTATFWGGVQIPGIAELMPVTQPISVPTWFKALDRNGDGFISPREFLGSPEAFRRLDLDGDGRISPAEAAKAK